MSSNPVTALPPPAHPGEALTTDPADAAQHPEHSLPPTRASPQQRVTTPGMPRTGHHAPAESEWPVASSIRRAAARRIPRSGT
jgi:hypothetical protein